jgi:hypothetical protein
MQANGSGLSETVSALVELYPSPAVAAPVAVVCLSLGLLPVLHVSLQRTGQVAPSQRIAILFLLALSGVAGPLLAPGAAFAVSILLYLSAIVVIAVMATIVIGLLTIDPV